MSPALTTYISTTGSTTGSDSTTMGSTGFASVSSGIPISIILSALAFKLSSFKMVLFHLPASETPNPLTVNLTTSPSLPHLLPLTTSITYVPSRSITETPQVTPSTNAITNAPVKACTPSIFTKPANLAEGATASTKGSGSATTCS